jgi:hypothetical protein
MHHGHRHKVWYGYARTEFGAVSRMAEELQLSRPLWVLSVKEAPK